MVQGREDTLAGCDRATSFVVNPHKWLFTPFDLSAFYCRRMDRLREAFSLTPDYLQSREPEGVRNLMDTGVQLGRRFRALELLVKQKRLNRTAAVPCIIRTDGLAEEDSLAENIQRAPLHPLDQFRAFVSLRDKG